MFYLKLFINAFLEKKVNAIIYSLSFFIMLGAFLYQSEIALFASNTLSVKRKALSFKIAYRENQMTNGFEAKILKIPGVLKIVPVQQDSINKNIQKVLLKYDINQELLNLERFQGLKIILHEDLSIKNQEMVRTYVSKLLANTNSFVAPLSVPNQDLLIQTGNFRGVSLQVLKISMFIAFLSFLISFYFMLMNLYKKSFIVENYQRKKYVALKSLAIGHSPLIFLLLWGIYSEKFQKSFIFLIAILSLGFILTIVTKSQERNGKSSL